jgi:hypothetical protein
VVNQRKFLVVSVPILVVLLAGLATGLLIKAHADANDDWPSFVMIYEIEGGVSSVGLDSPKSTSETHRLEYNSKDKWLDTVIESEPVTTNVGTFSEVGSYQKAENGTITRFGSVFGEIREEKIGDNTRRIPNGFLKPFQLQELEALGEDSTEVTTTSTVCVRGQCIENATGLKLVFNGKEHVFAADTNGIPLKIGDSFLVMKLEID